MNHAAELMSLYDSGVERLVQRLHQERSGFDDDVKRAFCQLDEIEGVVDRALGEEQATTARYADKMHYMHEQCQHVMGILAQHHSMLAPAAEPFGEVGTDDPQALHQDQQRRHVEEVLG